MGVAGEEGKEEWKLDRRGRGGGTGFIGTREKRGERKKAEKPSCVRNRKLFRMLVHQRDCIIAEDGRREGTKAEVRKIRINLARVCADQKRSRENVTGKMFKSIPNYYHSDISTPLPRLPPLNLQRVEHSSFSLLRINLHQSSVSLSSDPSRVELEIE